MRRRDGGVSGFIGFFIIHTKFHGRGFGRQLWTARRDRLMKRLHAPARIEMNGVFDMQSFYAKGGFQFFHHDLRFQRVESARDNSAATSIAIASGSTVVNSATINSNISLIHQHNSGNSAPSQTYSIGTSVVDLTTIAKYFWRDHI